MDLKEVKAWFMNPLTCISGHSRDMTDWLITEGERLTADFEAVRDEMKAIALALGRSKTDGETDCDWHDLAGEVDTLRASHEATIAELGRVRAENEALKVSIGYADRQKESWLTAHDAIYAENKANKAELAKVKAEGDAAYQKGRKDMREEAAELAGSFHVHGIAKGLSTGAVISKAIYAIPTEGREPKCHTKK